jgi:hypothetical protein
MNIFPYIMHIVLAKIAADGAENGGKKQEMRAFLAVFY